MEKNIQFIVEDVEQGINEPCFFIVPLNPSKTPYPSGRELKKKFF
ncbi:DUF6838 family protein [Clostridioides difficile]